MQDTSEPRACTVQAPRSGDGQGKLRLLRLRSGPADGPDGLGTPARAPARQFDAGKALRAVARALPRARRPAARLGHRDLLALPLRLDVDAVAVAEDDDGARPRAGLPRGRM